MKNKMRWLTLLVAVFAVLSLTGCEGVVVNVDVDPTSAASTSTDGETTTESATEEPASVTEEVTTEPTEPAEPTEAAPEVDEEVPDAAETETTTETGPTETESPEETVDVTGEESTTTEPTPEPAVDDVCAAEAQSYTVVWTEEQMSTILDGAFMGVERAFLGIRSVSLQDGKITVYSQYEAPRGTVDATFIFGVTTQNYDLIVTLEHAQIGQIGVTDARKNAINSAVQWALESQIAQGRDYTCFDSAVAANGTLTIVYH
ncbi:MAG: hypothetical protein ACP5GX_03160 [Anaerolineae bacterium]